VFCRCLSFTQTRAGRARQIVTLAHRSGQLEAGAETAHTPAVGGMNLYNTVHNVAALMILVALGWVTVVSGWALVNSTRDGDALRAWVGAIVFLLALVVDVWFFWRML
jgi:hypothetical protein